MTILNLDANVCFVTLLAKKMIFFINTFKNLTIAYWLLFSEVQDRNYLSSENLRTNKISFSFKHLHYFKLCNTLRRF